MMNVTLAQPINTCCWPLMNNNCKQVAPEFYTFGFFFLLLQCSKSVSSSFILECSALEVLQLASSAE